MELLLTTKSLLRKADVFVSLQCGVRGREGVTEQW